MQFASRRGTATPEAILRVHIEKVTINVYWRALAAVPGSVVAPLAGRISRP